MVVLMYLAAVGPFDTPLMNRMEVFNEFCILLASTHLFWFTDYVPDPEIQYLYGWSLIGVSIFNIIINMLVMLWMSLSSLKLLYWKLRNKFLEWRIKKRAEAKAKIYSAVGNSSGIDQEKGKNSNNLKLEDIKDDDNPTSDNRTGAIAKKGKKKHS